MKLVRIYFVFVVISASLLYAMETTENISWLFYLNPTNQKIAALAPLTDDTLAYVRSEYSADSGYVNDFFVIAKNTLWPRKLIQINGHLSAIEITPAGNLLYAGKNGKLGFYLSDRNESKIFTTGLNSSIVAIQNNIIIKNSDKKLCKAIAAIGTNGDLLCIHDDNNFRKLNLFDALKPDQQDYRNDKEITVADIKPFSIGYELLPFVAYAIRYTSNQDLISDKYSKSVFVYNPILNKISTFQTGEISDICFLPNYNICVASSNSNNKSITLFDAFKAEKLYTMEIPERGIFCAGRIFHDMFNDEAIMKVVSCTSSSCGKYIATIDDSCHLSVWDVDTGARIYKKNLDICPCGAVKLKMAFSCDGNFIYVCGKGSQKIYNIKDFAKHDALSPTERENAIRNFTRSQNEKKDNISILRLLRNRELGLKIKK